MQAHAGVSLPHVAALRRKMGALLTQLPVHQRVLRCCQHACKELKRPYSYFTVVMSSIYTVSTWYVYVQYVTVRHGTVRYVPLQ